MTSLLSICDRASRYLAEISALLVGAIAVFILAEIVARSLFNISLSFAWEYSAYCMAVSVFCGAAYTLHTAGHVRVSILSQNVPPRVAWLVDLGATLAGVAIVGFIAWALCGLAIQSGVNNSRSATPLEVPLVVPQAAMALGSVLLLLQVLVRLVRLLTGQPTEAHPDSDYSVE